MWWSLHSSSFQLNHLLRSVVHALPKGRGRRGAQRQRKRIPKPYEFQDDAQDGYGHGRARAVAVDLREREMAPRKPQWLGNQTAHAIQWLGRLNETYGASFMLLVVLGYCTQGFRCFPWLAMCYFFKDHLQVLLTVLSDTFSPACSVFLSLFEAFVCCQFVGYGVPVLD